MTKSTLLISTAVGLTVAVAGPAAAAKRHVPANIKARASITQLATRKPLHNVGQGVNKAWADGVLYEGWNTSTAKTVLPYNGTNTFAYPVDRETGIKCAGGKYITKKNQANACLVETEHEVEVLNFATVPTQFAIIPILNGFTTNGSGYFAGAHSSSNQFINKELRTNCMVAQPVSTATTYVLAESSTQITAHHQSDYTVFKKQKLPTNALYNFCS